MRDSIVMPKAVFGERVFTNCRLALPNEEILGTLVVRDGIIADIQPGISAVGEDGFGEYLLPGFVDLHTDHFERAASPRPRVRWPLDSASIYHDRNLAVGGITTACDAVPLIRPEQRGQSSEFFLQFIEALDRMEWSGSSTLDHRLHLRCEIGYSDVVAAAMRLAAHPRLALMSLMDHTPGQRQFRDIERLRGYRAERSTSAEPFDDFVARTQRERVEFGEPNRQSLAELARENSIVLATHDDAEVEHVQMAVRDGATIIEFPTTLEAAQEARRQGLAIVMGAPNFVLGGSQSGNVSALELAQLGLVDIIASDYVPQSMVQAVFIAAAASDVPLWEAVKMVSEYPARAIGLFDDRGSLEIGKRADLVTVTDRGEPPRLTSVVVRGHRIA